MYQRQTAPLLGEFDDDERLVMVDGTGTVDEVAGRMVRELQIWCLRRPIAD